MSSDAMLVDRIVASVMSQLLTGTQPVRAAHIAPGKNGKPGSNEKSNDAFLITEPVITGKLLEERAGDHRSIQFGPDSVLTPSAREFLKSRKIVWSRNHSAASAAQRTGSWLAVTVHATSAARQAIETIDKANAGDWKHELVGTTAEAVELSVSSLCRHDAVGAIVFARETARIVCLANRNSRIRAASATNINAVRAARQEIGANLLCIDPVGKAFVELRNMLRAYSAEGAPAPPAGWK